MATVVVTVNGLPQVFALTDNLENPDWTELLEIIGATIEEQTINHFQEQGGPSGPWAPTQRGGQILVDTGTLRGSITHDVVPPDSVYIGNLSHANYGHYHQFGTPTLPKREYLGLTGSDSDELSRVLENYVAGMLR